VAGPVPTYLDTQLAAQSAFSVPFGLLTLVNADIATAVAAGEFNTTVDCSLFVAEDVSNLRIYLDSLGYLVEFAKNSGNKSLLIDWGKPLDIDGGGEGSTTVTQGTTPWVVSEENVDKNFGAWAYYSGISGTVVVGGSQRVIGIGAYSLSGGSLTIAGGSIIPIPAGVDININPLANLMGPTIVFTGTDSYFVEVVS